MNIHGGGGGDAHLLKKSWGEGVKIKKNHWARGLSNIEKHGGGGGGGLSGENARYAKTPASKTPDIQVLP